MNRNTYLIFLMICGIIILITAVIVILYFFKITQKNSPSPSECKNLGKVFIDGQCLSYNCVSDTDCQDGMTCLQQGYNLCVKRICSIDKECPDGMQCKDGSCKPIKYTPANIPCTSPDTCGCRNNDDCPKGDKCIKFLCLPFGCKSDSECSPGQKCFEGTCLVPQKCYNPNPGRCTQPNLDMDKINSLSSTNHVLVFYNSGTEEVYVATTLPGGDAKTPGAGGFPLKPGEINYISVANNTSSFRAWVRTGCRVISEGDYVLRCFTGACTIVGQNQNCSEDGCNSAIACMGLGGQRNATLFEGTFTQSGDYLDISIIDGINSSISVYPISNTVDDNCTPFGTTINAGGCCSFPIQDNNGNKACYGASSWYSLQNDIDKQDLYGCAGNVWSNPINCNPSKWDKNYAAIYSQMTPEAYTFPYDDLKATRICSSSQNRYSSYVISFCDAIF